MDENDVRHSEPAGEITVMVLNFEPRRCAVCRETLMLNERKVHRDRCARIRKTQLQQLRRRRHWKGTPRAKGRE